MTATEGSTIHASCVLVGRTAVLIRGPSGSGKSRLVSALLDAAASGKIPFARLVADDRVRLTAANGRLIAAAPSPLAGKIEIHGKGIREVAHEPLALVGLVIDIGASDSARMPEAAAREVEISGVKLSRLPVESVERALTAIFAEISAVTDA